MHGAEVAQQPRHDPMLKQMDILRGMVACGEPRLEYGSSMRKGK